MLTQVDKADVSVRCVPMSVEVLNMLPSNEMLIILMTNAKNFTQFLFVHVRKLGFFKIFMVLGITYGKIASGI